MNEHKATEVLIIRVAALEASAGMALDRSRYLRRYAYETVARAAGLRALAESGYQLTDAAQAGVGAEHVEGFGQSGATGRLSTGDTDQTK